MLNSAETLAALAHLMSRSIHLFPIGTGTSTLRDDVREQQPLILRQTSKTVFGDRAIQRFD